MSSITSLFGGLKPKFQIFDASGTFTPSAALLAAGGNITVKLWGAGGGGGFGYSYQTNGIGGNAGNYITKPLNVSAAQTVTIGSGGAAGSSASAFASDGGNSTFGSLLTSEGGAGGAGGNLNSFSISPIWKASPNGTSPYVVYYGSSGYFYTGTGGSAKDIGLGGTTGGGTFVPAPGGAGIASGGAGGNGYGGSSFAGSAGGNGYCIVEWWE